MIVAKLNEAELLAAGFSRQTVEAFRHILIQAGKVLGQETLPEVASGQDATAQLVAQQQILLAASIVRIAELETERESFPPPNNQLARRLDDMQAEFDRSQISAAGLVRELADMRSDFEGLGTTNNSLARRVADLENGVN